MNCTQSEELIQMGIDGALTPAERNRLDAHLSICADCRRAWDEARRLAQMADRWARPTLADDPGEAWTAAILSKIAAQPEHVPPRAFDTIWLPLAALLCLAAAFITLLPSLTLPSFEALAGSARLLPQWLLTNWHSLISDALALTNTPLTVALPRYAWPVLLLFAALNSAFFVHARRGQPQRSLS